VCRSVQDISGHVTRYLNHRRVSPIAMPSPAATSDAKHTLDPVLDFMRLLWSIEHGLQRMSKRMEAELLGITGPHRLVLRLVGVRGCRPENSPVLSYCTQHDLGHFAPAGSEGTSARTRPRR
jgi:hypothetical protein